MTLAPADRELPVPDSGPAAAVRFVAEHLDHLVAGPIVASPAFRGGQIAADSALAAFAVAGYASRRNNVDPPSSRGASRLSPYIRHGLLSLPEVKAATGDGPSRDVAKFHDELLWQEFARHWYARHGTATRRGIRRKLTPAASRFSTASDDVHDLSMNCVAVPLQELQTDGWLVNQTRMWLASHWAIRHGADWRDGEDFFFRHLLDGSRAANRLGWQWTTGVGSAKHYGFSRWQVNKRAPSLCSTCVHADNCPIEQWPADPVFSESTHTNTENPDPDPTAVFGPLRPQRTSDPEVVWLTGESLGHRDPALEAHPDLPVVFVFDEALLTRLQLTAKRLIFFTETLAELAQHRSLRVVLGDPVRVLRDEAVSVTFAPVPGFKTRVDALNQVELQPWPWLKTPNLGSHSSFSAWRRSG